MALAVINDPRDPRGRRYPLVSILAAAVCAVLARGVHVRGGRGLDALWRTSRCGLGSGSTARYRPRRRCGGC
ncbi:transposase family protein [Micromonospora sp. WMMA1363]|uniref:transposase family protein n=1 Tax=Micromonospora sp. WMMA1363 TaxID=3053985 RepID=UPI00259CB779|nr:transposase family protein [Micromonospora sp. WMMA1363]MDM4722552.1 transposase family protein [Micromonospora sp. WMMA1363]